MGKPSARVGLIVMLEREGWRERWRKGDKEGRWRERDESVERETERERLNLGIELRLKKSYIYSFHT